MKSICIVIILFYSCSTLSSNQSTKERILKLQIGTSITIPGSSDEIKLISMNKWMFSKDERGLWKGTDVVRFQATINGFVSQNDLSGSKTKVKVGQYQLSFLDIQPPLSYTKKDSITNRSVIFALNRIKN
jgi:hypothetical protein